MGCCLSKATTETQNQNPYDHNSLKTHQPHLRSSLQNSNPTHEAAPPSPPPLEEESVKEVLSETPISKPQQVPILIPETKTPMPLVQNPAEDFETKDPNPIVKAEEVSELVSQLSEPCSMSESFSTATTATITEKKEEDEATSKRSNRDPTTTTHKWNRSPSYASSRKRPYSVDGNIAGGRERRLKSPKKRPEPSPEKKIQGGSRPIRGRESGPAANRNINAGFRRDPGEGSGRRSRSPSCGRTIGGTTKVCAGGGRKQVPPVDAVVGKEKKSESEEVGDKSDVVTQEESVENPHVSMECFIFL